MTDLSVVIITRNRLPKLKRCIDSVCKKLSGAEVIVVDNGSVDGTVEFLQTFRSVKIKLLKTNVGVATARNVGIRLASRGFMMFLDDDAWVGELPIDTILDYFRTNQTVGIIGPKILYANGSIQESARSFPTIMALLWRGSGLYKILPNVPWYTKYVGIGSDRIHAVDWVIGACMIVRSEVLNVVGLFDGRYFLVYDDADFCRRIMSRGFSTVFWPDAKVFHDYERSSAKGINRNLMRHILSICRFLGPSKSF